MPDAKSPDTVWRRASVTRARRNGLNGHRSAVVWLTGLSGSGKSTLAHAVEERLHGAACRTVVPDGDNVRHGLCAELGFSDADRADSIGRVGEAARLLVDAGMVVPRRRLTPAWWSTPTSAASTAEQVLALPRCRAIPPALA